MTTLDEFEVGCQMPSMARISVGRAQVPPQSLARRLKLVVRRRMSPRRERAFKRLTNAWRNGLARLTGGTEKPTGHTAAIRSLSLTTGDRVRVRSEEEIRSTLDHWRQLRGCTFMPEMAQYCGTDQVVFKRMERFVDERDLRVKRAKGIVLLQGLRCAGTADFGPCDRSCYYFWREEWLAKLD